MADAKISALTANTVPAPTDIIVMVDDPSGSPLTQKITYANFMKIVGLLTAETTIATNDLIALYDTSGASADSMTIENLFKVVNAFTEDTAPASGDYVLTYDISASTVKKVTKDNIINLNTGALFGLTLSNNVTDPTNDIDIAAGKARDVGDTMNMTLSSAITKRIDATWVVGSGSGGLDYGTLADGTYHKHLIKRSDTSVVDALFSLSHDLQDTVTMTIASPCVVTWNGKNTIGHGLVAGSTFKFSTTGALPTGITAGTVYYVITTGLTATTFRFAATAGGAAINSSGSQSGVHTGISIPLMPSGYDGYRRIGSVVRASAALKTFIQDGDDFTWLVPVADISVTNPGTSAVTRTLTVPVGIRTKVKVSILGFSNALAADNPQGIYLSDLAVTDSAAGVSIFSLNVYTAVAGVTQLGAMAEIYTNSNSQIRSRIQVSTASTGLRINTHGWSDTRGRLK